MNKLKQKEITQTNQTIVFARIWRNSTPSNVAVELEYVEGVHHSMKNYIIYLRYF